MIDRAHPLPLTRQSSILEISRSGLHYEAVPVKPRDLDMMRLNPTEPRLGDRHNLLADGKGVLLPDGGHGLGNPQGLARLSNTLDASFCVDALEEAGKGRWRDNVFVERLWKSVKYEEVYLKAYGSIAEARRGLRKYFEFYNQRRRHQGLDRKTPDEVYRATLRELVAA